MRRRQFDEADVGIALIIYLLLLIIITPLVIWRGYGWLMLALWTFIIVNYFYHSHFKYRSKK